MIHHPELFRERDGTYTLVWMQEVNPQRWARVRLAVPRAHGLRLEELGPDVLYRYIEARRKESERVETDSIVSGSQTKNHRAKAAKGGRVSAARRKKSNEATA